MNVNEAMEAASCYPGLVPLFCSEIVAITLAKEVKRLRDELAEAKAESVGLGESHDRLEAELAAAKAASVVPVQVLNIFEGTYESDRYIELRTDAEADTFTDWLRDRMKDTTPPQA